MICKVLKDGWIRAVVPDSHQYVYSVTSVIFSHGLAALVGLGRLSEVPPSHSDTLGSANDVAAR